MIKNALHLFSFKRLSSHIQIRLLTNYPIYCRHRIFHPNMFPNRSFCTPNAKSNLKTQSTNIMSTIIPKEQDNSKKENEQEDPAKQRESSWRAMKYTFIAFGVSFGTLAAYLLIELGKPVLDSQGNPMRDEFTHLPTFKQYFYRMLRELDYYKRMIKEPSREKLLPDPVKPPYYQPPYTLILEMTDVLVHPDWTYQTGWRFKKRPGIDHFLESLNGIFEIVIFTAEQGMTVFPIIDALDPNNIISYKLVRDATHFVDGHHVKDLNKLNRDLTKVIVIDWNPASVKFHSDNLFFLPRWNGNDEDSTLIDLASFLRTIASSEIDDVRDVLKYYNQFPDPLQTFREKQKHLMEQQEQNRQAQESKFVPVVKRWAPSLTKKQL